MTFLPFQSKRADTVLLVSKKTLAREIFCVLLVLNGKHTA